MKNQKLFFSLAILGVILDQIVKFLIEFYKPMIDLGLFSFHFVKNTGASFGMFKGSNIPLMIVAIVALIAISFFYNKLKERQKIAILFLSSGIIGNLIDRIFRGFVVDFIDFKFFPVFNIADSLIVLSTIWLAIELLFEKKNQ
jgi:signal peptidase II